MVQLSYPYMTTGKTIALTRQTFVGKVMSLFFNMLSRLVVGWASLVAWLVKNPCAMQEDLDSIPGLGRSPGERKGYPLQYSGLENSMYYAVHGILQARILESVAFPFSRGSSQPRD